MIKLTNQQVAALSSKIYDDLIQPIREHNKLILNSKEYENFESTNNDCIILDEIKNKYNLDNYNFNNIKSQIKNKYFKDKLQSYNITKSDIEQEIVLATIESKDLQSLIEIVSQKFAK